MSRFKITVISGLYGPLYFELPISFILFIVSVIPKNNNKIKYDFQILKWHFQ